MTENEYQNWETLVAAARDAERHARKCALQGNTWGQKLSLRTASKWRKMIREYLRDCGER